MCLNLSMQSCRSFACPDSKHFRWAQLWALLLQLNAADAPSTGGAHNWGQRPPCCKAILDILTLLGWVNNPCWGPKVQAAAAGARRQQRKSAALPECLPLGCSEAHKERPQLCIELPAHGFSRLKLTIRRHVAGMRCMSNRCQCASWRRVSACLQTWLSLVLIKCVLARLYYGTSVICGDGGWRSEAMCACSACRKLSG